MADIQIPQRNPPIPQFQGAPADLINTLWNRPTGPERLAASVNDVTNMVYDKYLKNQSRKIQGVEALANLYGNGGEWLANKLGPQISQATGVQDPTQVQQQSQYHPNDQYGTIQASVSMGHPDPLGYYSQPSQSQAPQPAQPPQAPGAASSTSYSQSQPGLQGAQGIQDYLSSHPGVGGKQLTNQIALAKGLGDLQMMPLSVAEKEASIRSANSKFATPEQGAAIASADPNAIAGAYGGVAPIDAYTNAANKAMEVKKTIAGEVSKQSQDTQNITQLKTLAANLQGALAGHDSGILGNVSGDIYQASGGRVGSSTAAAIQNAANPLATALNTELARRFNSGEVALLSQSLIPQPKDTPAFAQQKIANLNRLLDSMASGNEANVRNVAAAITTGAIPKVGGQPTSEKAPTTASAPAITSKAEYDALSPGTSYTWNGKHHIKGRS